MLLACGGPTVWLGQASPGDSDAGVMWTRSLRNTPLKPSSSSSITWTSKYPAFSLYKHESSRRWFPQVHHSIGSLPLSRPATKETISIQDMVNIESSSDLAVTPVFKERKKEKKSSTVCFSYSGFQHILFCRPPACSFWGPTWVSIPIKRPINFSSAAAPRSRAPNLWLEFQ